MINFFLLLFFFFTNYVVFLFPRIQLNIMSSRIRVGVGDVVEGGFGVEASVRVGARVRIRVEVGVRVRFNG